MLIRQYKSHQKIRHDSQILNNYGLAMHQPQYSTSKVFKTLWNFKINFKHHVYRSSHKTGITCNKDH